MKKQLERELREKDRIDRIVYDSVMAQYLIQLAIRLQNRDIINHLGERIN